MSTVLKDALRNAIKLRGPIPISTYMSYCLTHETEGYYTKKDPLGIKGDFITSPEISQMFGELIGINLLTQWMQHGKPHRFRIVELGPGRGTLMADLLRAAKTFPSFYDSIQEIRFIEASPILKAAQENLLRKYSGIEMNWCKFVNDVPKDKIVTFFIAHEFFDALPIRAFVKSKNGWCEQLVQFNEDKNQFEFTTSPHVSWMNEILSRQPRFENLPNLSEIEICPDGWEVAHHIGSILDVNSGGALVMDYGPTGTIPTRTFRAFKKHHQIDPFLYPGDSDLTADVDFRALVDIFSQRDSLRVFGPVKQADWLHAMGIGARATMLANNQKDSEGVQRISDAYSRLTDPIHMGKIYKVMGVSSRLDALAGF